MIFCIIKKKIYHQMKVLITSGGSNVLATQTTGVVDGELGSGICDEFWKRIVRARETDEDDEVANITFLHAKGSMLLSRENLFNECHDSTLKKVSYVEYVVFNDFESSLLELVKSNHYDIIVLADSMSGGYFVREVANESASGKPALKLARLPDVTNEVSKLIPSDTLLCKVIFLANSSGCQTAEEVDEQLRHSRVDLVFGDNLVLMGGGDARSILAKSNYNNESKTFEKSLCNLPEAIVDECISSWKKFRAK